VHRWISRQECTLEHPFFEGLTLASIESAVPKYWLRLGG